MEHQRRWVEAGTLYLVGTPIGNLADMAPRALAVLREVDLVCAEDTRRSGPWLRREGITTPMQSLHEHSSAEVIRAVADRLTAGEAVAVVTDAGMPGIADPGAALVNLAWQRGIRVVPIPGPNAAVMAFAASGFPLPVTIWGFLPARGPARREQAEAVLQAPGTHVLYEAPHRLEATLELLAALDGDGREIVVARELTKLYEALWRGPLSRAPSWVGETPVRGEYTLVIGPRPAAPRQDLSWPRLLEEVDALMATDHTTPAEACRQVAHVYGVPRRELYRRWVQNARG
jgi:16S rRNA (cytidine1402-2'-O)-methyltransferase